MMKLCQFIVFFAVLISNAEYRWTPNPYAAGLIALMATIFVTALIIEIRARLLGLGPTPKPASLAELMRSRRA
jgi:hypothetical protein